MSVHDRSVRSIACAIERYLSLHPEASDSPTGIRGFWLPRPLRAEPLPLVMVALDQLEQRGLVAKRQIEDGGVIYARAKPRPSRR
jgi:hypothetical protein